MFLVKQPAGAGRCVRCSSPQDSQSEEAHPGKLQHWQSQQVKLWLLRLNSGFCLKVTVCFPLWIFNFFFLNISSFEKKEMYGVRALVYYLERKSSSLLDESDCSSLGVFKISEIWGIM